MSWAFYSIALFSAAFAAGMATYWIFGKIIWSRNVAPPESGHVFTFVNRELVAASPAAHKALSLEDLDEDIFNMLLDRLSPVFPTLKEKFADAITEQTAFEISDVIKDGPVSVRVEFPENQIKIRVEGINAPLSRKIILDQDYAKAAEDELRVLRGTVDASPIPTWREDALGTIDWVNRAYLNLLNQTKDVENIHAWPPARLFESGTIAKPGTPAKSRRGSVSTVMQGPRWFDIYSYGKADNSLHFAIDAEPIVQAEESLRKFMQTLTQTFASLPIGLAIFDRSRKIVMFNPALTELTSLEPQWLSLRPTLYDFLNELREKRMLPERKDFSDWRQKITALEQSAVDGTYSETWTLPGGQTYRMTGRPHPEGAIAFLFEDITAEISLTRKFRQELELSQSLFDNIPEAIAVFSADGIINMSNAAYAALWGVDPHNALGQINIQDATRLWQGTTRPTPLWGDARDFISQIGERSEWFGNVQMTSGIRLNCRFTPLPRGATLVGFTTDETGINTAPTKPEFAYMSS